MNVYDISKGKLPDPRAVFRVFGHDLAVELGPAWTAHNKPPSGIVISGDETRSLVLRIDGTRVAASMTDPRPEDSAPRCIDLAYPLQRIARSLAHDLRSGMLPAVFVVTSSGSGIRHVLGPGRRGRTALCGRDAAMPASESGKELTICVQCFRGYIGPTQLVAQRWQDPAIQRIFGVTTGCTALLKHIIGSYKREAWGLDPVGLCGRKLLHVSERERSTSQFAGRPVCGRCAAEVGRRSA
jgi:hypothetical protein